MGAKRTNEELCIAIQSGDKDAFQELMDNNKELIFKLANKHVSKFQQRMPYKYKANKTEIAQMIKEYYPENVDQDYVQAGYTGMYRAALKYDKKNTANFITYAYRFINGEILKEYLRNVISYTVPKRDKEKYKQFKEEYDVLYQSEMPYKEIILKISEKFDTSVDHVERVLGITYDLQDINDNYYKSGDEDEDITIEDIIPGDYNVEKEYSYNDMKRNLNQFVSELGLQERTVINMLFGLAGYNETSVAEIARQNHITEKKVAAIRDKAFKKLRERVSEIM